MRHAAPRRLAPQHVNHLTSNGRRQAARVACCEVGSMKLYQGWHSGPSSSKFPCARAIVAVQCSAEGVPAPHKISLDGLNSFCCKCVDNLPEQ